MLKPVIDRTFPLERAPEAQTVLEQRENVGKIILEIGKSPTRSGQAWH